MVSSDMNLLQVSCRQIDMVCRQWIKVTPPVIVDGSQAR